MTEKNPGEKKTLSLKRGPEQSVIRQSFSHGRTKAVVVEKVRRRGGPGEAKAPEPAPTTAPTTPSPSARRAPTKASPAAATSATVPSSKPSGVVLPTLTEEERVARAHALGNAKLREAEERRVAEEDARRRSERDTRERAEREAAEARKREEEDRRRHDEETKRKAEQEAKKRFGEDEAKAKASVPSPAALLAAPAPRTSPFMRI